MQYSPQNHRKRFTWGMLHYFLGLFVGLILVQAARAEDQQPLVNYGNVSGPVIGINVGTSYSRVSFVNAGGGRYEIIANDHGSRVTPSWVAFTDEDVLVGEAAKDQFANNPHRTVFDITRLIGRKFNDKSLQEAIKRFPFKIIDKGGELHVRIKIKGIETTFTPEEIMSMVLQRLKEVAEKHISEPIHRAVVAVPAYFNDAQRAATRKAGRIAGLDILLVIDEPTAAALAYRLDENTQTGCPLNVFGPDKNRYERQVLVYDLGASTLDVSVVTIEDGVVDVQTTASNTHLGGEDFNDRVINFIAEKYNKNNGVDVTKNVGAMEKLRWEVEKAKHTLSSQETTTIEIRSFHNGGNFTETLTRAQFEILNNALFDKTLDYVKKALKEARMDRSDVDDIVLVGGCSRLPKIEQMLENFFGKKTHKDINPEEAIAIGAAVQSSIFAIGIGADEGCCMGPFTLASLGLEATGGAMVHIIERGTNIPIKKSRIFSTSVDNQSLFPLRIFEGEHYETKDNHMLAEFQPNIIPLGPRGISQIEITFDLDCNNVLTVSALNKNSGKSDSFIVPNSNRLTIEDVERMIEEAVSDAEDEFDYTRYNSLSKLRDYVYTLKWQSRDIKGLGSKLIEDDKKFLVEAIKKTEDWLDHNAASAAVEEFDKQFQNLFDEVEPIILRATHSSWWHRLFWWCCARCIAWMPLEVQRFF